MDIDVKYVAALARLKLTGEEEREFSRQLKEILGYMEKLNAVDTSGVEPTSHAMDLKNVLREDAAESAGCSEEILANAPDRDGNYFKVKKVIE